MTCVVAQGLHQREIHRLRRGVPIDCFYVGETMLVIQALFMDRLRRSSRHRPRRAASAS